MNLYFILTVAPNQSSNSGLLSDATLWAAIIAGIVALLTSVSVSIVSSRLQKRSNFIETITSNRINWITKLRELVDDFVTITRISNNSQVYNTVDERLEYFEKLSHLKNQIILHLNYKGYLDKEIIRIICQIMSRIEVLYEVFEMFEIKNPTKRYEHVLGKFGDDIFKGIVASLGDDGKGFKEIVKWSSVKN